MPKQVAISEAVYDVLSRSTIGGPADRPFLILPKGELPRPLYVDVDKVLKALGGKWNRGVGGHVFDRPVDGQLAEALRCRTAVDQKRTQEQFFTPKRIAADLAQRLEIDDGTHVLEPSAGAGALVDAAMALGAHVTAVERDDLLIAGLREVGHQREGWLRVCHADFMEWELRDAPPSDHCHFGPVDAVLMNPPFSRGQDMAHVTRALEFLRPGGRLGAIMSPHWRFAEDRQSVGFRAMMNPLTYLWTPLPDGSFVESGTSVNCGFLAAFKGN